MCNICEKFRSESLYAANRHVQEQHSGFKFKCQDCGTTLARKDQEHGKCRRGFPYLVVNINNRSSGKIAKEEMEKWYKEILPMQVTRICSPRPMPSSSRSRSRSPLRCKDYDEVSIDEGDDQFEKEEEEIKVMNSLEKMQRETVQLDVGGYKFKTTKETLTKIPSKLSKLITLKSANVPTYFLDRDPKHFGIILNFLRNGEIDERTLPEERGSLAAILTECKYYGLVELENMVRKKLDVCKCNKSRD